jgi:hypothetical protein
VFGAHKVKIDRALFVRIQRHARLAGYSSVDEFVTHALEKEIARLDASASEDEISKRLKGLGYLS